MIAKCDLRNGDLFDRQFKVIQDSTDLYINNGLYSGKSRGTIKNWLLGSTNPNTLQHVDTLYHTDDDSKTHKHDNGAEHDDH
mgnify:CR=1 FL=1